MPVLTYTPQNYERLQEMVVKNCSDDIIINEYAKQQGASYRQDTNVIVRDAEIYSEKVCTANNYLWFEIVKQQEIYHAEMDTQTAS